MLFSNSSVHWIEYQARSKLLQQHERHKSVDAGARSVLLFLIQKLQDLITSYSKKKLKKNKTLIFLNPYIHWIQYSGRSMLFHQHETKNSVHAEARLVLLFLIQKLQELTSFCSKLFKRFFFSNYYTTLSVPVKKILDIFWKK